jgi:YbbR domain-containing protein
MAFREEKRKYTPGDARRLVAEWLREIFLEDLGLKLLALVVAVGLWLAVTSLRAPATTRRRGIPLEFVLPEQMEISNDVADDVDVTLQGSQGWLSEIDTRNLVARADITQLRPGERVVRLTPQNVTMDLPTGVRVVAIEPRSVNVRLEPIIEREVEVEARFEGTPPPGYARGQVQVEPPRVRVRGPESHVLAVEKAHTDTISLEGQRETLVRRTDVDTEDRKVVPLDAVVTVRVEITEERVEKRFPEIAVVSAVGGQPQPASAAVTLRGPRSVLDALRPQDIRLTLEQTGDGPPRPRLTLPPNLEGRLELVATAPAEFAINR